MEEIPTIAFVQRQQQHDYTHIELLIVIINGMLRENADGESEFVQMAVVRPKACVELIKDDGTRECVYEGDNMEMAIFEANRFSQAMNLSVKDMRLTANRMH
jgi:hypothetical protein